MASHHICSSDSKLTDENEHLSDKVCKCKFGHVSHLEQEHTPSRVAEAISSDSLIGIGRFIEIITNLFDASEAASSASYDSFDYSILS